MKHAHFVAYYESDEAYSPMIEWQEDADWEDTDMIEYRQKANEIVSESLSLRGDRTYYLTGVMFVFDGGERGILLINWGTLASSWELDWE